MKNYSKLSIIILQFFLAFTASAQDYGVKAGLNITNMLVKESNFFSYKDNFQINTGFHVGPTVEFHLLDFLSVEGGLLFNTKGYTGISEETVNNETYKIQERKNLFFLDVPLTLKVPFSVGNYKFYGIAGGYAGAGLMGDSKISSYYGNRITKLNWGSDEGSDDLKRYDYGLTFGAGINVDPFRIGISYNMGLANLSPESTGAKLSNRVLGISVGYSFGRTPETVKEIKSVEEKPISAPAKQPETSKVKISGRRKAEIEAEKLRLEKIRTDSIAAVRAEEERIKKEKIRSDSIEAERVKVARAEAERLRLEKLKTDSIAASKKAAIIKTTKNVVVYKVQFASSTTKKGSYSINAGGKTYNTWEYFYNGAYRSTAGEFRTYKEALSFQNVMRKSGYPQAFVAAFINDKRTTDPALFR